MKKIVITSILVSIVIAAAFGDFNEKDLLFSNEQNMSIFPEINYGKNPAVIQGITAPLIFTDLDFDGSYEYLKEERVDSSVGVIGGTEIVDSLSLIPALGFTHFLPADQGPVFGYSLYYDSAHELSETRSLKFNDPSENDSLSAYNEAYSGGTDFYLSFSAGKEKPVDMGFSLGYGITYDPVMFSWFTDNAITPSLSYIQPSADEDDTLGFDHRLSFDYGLAIPDEGFDLMLGLNCTGIYSDRNTKYMPYDSNGDGHKDSVADFNTYYFLKAEVGGPENEVSKYSLEDYDLTGKINLVGSFVKPFSEKFSFILDADYHLIDYTYSHYLEHIIEAADETDGSYTNKYYNSSFGSFSATIGADFSNPEKKYSMRLGLSYSREAEQYSQEGDKSTDLSQFSSLNPGNYTELELGTEPVNNVLSANVDLYPDQTIVHSAGLVGRYEFQPENKTVLFLDFGVTGYYQKLIYRAYNLDTRTVWEESDVSAELGWLFESVAGVSFPLGENFSCMLDLKNIGLAGDLSVLDETLMYDIEELYASPDGSVNNSDEFSVGFSLDLAFIINL